MLRRGFLKSLAAIPFIGALVAKKPEETIETAIKFPNDVYTDGVNINGDLNMDTMGAWAGSFVLERNDGLCGWREHRPPFESNMGTNYSYADIEKEAGVQYRLNFTGIARGRIIATIHRRTESSSKQGLVHIYDADISRTG